MSHPTESPNSFPTRPPEAVALFNTVLTSELLVNACWAKEQQGSTGLAWPAAYLILPLTLHPEPRGSWYRRPNGPSATASELGDSGLTEPILWRSLDRKMPSLNGPLN